MNRLQAGIKAWIQCLKGELLDFIDDYDSALHRSGGKPEVKVSSCKCIGDLGGIKLVLSFYPIVLSFATRILIWTELNLFNVLKLILRYSIGFLEIWKIWKSLRIKSGVRGSLEKSRNFVAFSLLLVLRCRYTCQVISLVL